MHLLLFVCQAVGYSRWAFFSLVSQLSLLFYRRFIFDGVPTKKMDLKYCFELVGTQCTRNKYKGYLQGTLDILCKVLGQIFQSKKKG